MLTLREIFEFSSSSPLLFSRYLFLFLFTVMFGIYAFIHNRLNLRSLFLLCFGIFFYYRTGGWFFSLLILSAIYDYYLAKAIHKSNSKFIKRLCLVTSVTINLGLLAFFKYTFYFTDVINEIFNLNIKPVNIFYIASNQWFGTHFDISKIILPVGISFFTFQALSYTIEVYRKQIEPAKNLLDYGFFVTYFPQLIAGPIVRAVDFLPQISKKFNLTEREFGHAVFLIMGGFIKKTVISDYISINFVDRVFDSPQLYSGFDNLMAVYGYAIQIYCDFSGYSDMAIGISLLLGFRLPINFNSPYISQSITEFWRRWHISLSSWLRDYLYISLGGNRKGKIRTYINLLITMLLGGLWHGAATKFIIWGGLHGAALALHKAWVEYVPWAKKQNSKLYNFIAGVITFHFVCFCWIYFRADNVPTVMTILDRIFNNINIADILLKIKSYWKVFSFIAIGFVLHFIPKAFKMQTENYFSGLPFYLKILIVAIIIFAAFQVASSKVQPFIYFQF
ncbi:MAG: MBOAT family protein [Bacteroidetes bacterium]|nr:MBOAT family protein [Bacteroidota bacterium]